MTKNVYLNRQSYRGNSNIPSMPPSGKADQLPAMEFTVNGNGFPDSDIVRLVNASSEAEFMSLAARMQEIAVKDEYVGMSNEDIVKRIKPRLVQDPTELMRYVEYLDANVLEQTEDTETQPDATPDLEPDPIPE